MFLNVFNTAKAHIKGGKKFPEINGIVTFKEVILPAKVNGLPQSKDHCKGRFFGFHIHNRNFLYRKFE